MDPTLLTLPPLTLSLPIAQVTVHPGMARVERSGALPQGHTRVMITDLPPLLLESSLQVRIDGPGGTRPLEVISLRPGWEIPGAEPRPVNAAEEEQLEQDTRAAKSAHRKALAQVEQLKAQLVFWQSLTPGIFSSSTLPRFSDAPLSLPNTQDAWRSSLEQVEATLERLHPALLDAEKVCEEARKKVDWLSHLRQQNRKHTLVGVPRRTLLLELKGVGAQPATSAETGEAPPLRISLTYLTPGATWLPGYEVRANREGSRAELCLRVFIAQSTGEAWNGVKLSVSTADARYVTDLPTLASMRIGRKQPLPARTGWRPPPEGLSVLFEGYDRDRPAVRPPPAKAKARKVEVPKPPPPRMKELEDSDDLDYSSVGSVDVFEERPMSSQGFVMPPAPARDMATLGGMPMPSPGFGGPPPSVSAPSPKGGTAEMAKKASPSIMANVARSRSAGVPQSAPMREEFEGGGGGPGFAAPLEQSSGIDAGNDWLSFDHLRLAGPEDSGRGQLQRASEQALLRESLPDDTVRGDLERFLQRARAAAQQVPQLPLPPLSIRLTELTERFDYRYDAHFPLDVPSDGRYHTLTLLRAQGRSNQVYRSVPKAEPVVYRELQLQNPLSAPMLSGPCDLYLGDELVATSLLEKVGRGGALRLGLGVEDRIKIARNTHYKESAPGLLSSTLGLEHEVQITVSSQLEQPISVEILERIPVTDGDDVEIKELSIQPPAKPYDQLERGAKVRGGKLILLPVPARGQAQAKLMYRINLNNKLELYGGNRRD